MDTSEIIPLFSDGSIIMLFYCQVAIVCKNLFYIPPIHVGGYFKPKFTRKNPSLGLKYPSFFTNTQIININHSIDKLYSE